MSNSETQNILGVGEVIVHHVHAVIFQRIRAGTLMKDCFDLGDAKLVGHDGSAKFALVHVVDETRSMQIHELSRIGQVIYYKNVRDAVPIQLVYDIASNETRAA